MDYLEMAIKRVTRTLTSLILKGFLRDVLGIQESLAVRRDFPCASVPKCVASLVFNTPHQRATLVIIREPPLNIVAQCTLGSLFMLHILQVQTN